MHAQLLVLLAIALMTTGCAWSPTKDSWPLPPENLLKLHSPPLTAGSDVRAAQLHANRLFNVIKTNSNDRGAYKWATGDYVSLGAIMAVAGAMADKTGLINTGAGLSVLGISASDRFQYQVQQDAYENARVAVGCVITQAGRTNDNEVMWARTQQDAIPLRDAASTFSAGVVDAVNKIKEGLITRLKGIQSEPVKSSDIQRVIEERLKALEQVTLTEPLIKSKIKRDGTAIQVQKANSEPLTPEIAAVKVLRDKEIDLVPLELQPEVSKRIILLLSEVNKCAVGS